MAYYKESEPHFLDFHLNQWYELQPVHSQPDESGVSSAFLSDNPADGRYWRLNGEIDELCKELRFIALAGNQLPASYTQDFNRNPEDLNWIYFFQSGSMLDRSFVYFPAIEVPKVAQWKWEREGCGSILDTDGRPFQYVVYRPDTVFITGLQWNQNHPTFRPIVEEICGHGVKEIMHEMTHLGGGTAISHTNDILHRDPITYLRECYPNFDKTYGGRRFLAPVGDGTFVIITDENIEVGIVHQEGQIEEWPYEQWQMHELPMVE